MASLTQEKNGTRKILFVCPETGKRKSLRLGKIPKKSAESIKIRAEELVQYRVLGVPYTADFSQWLNHIERPLYRQFVKVGLLKDKIELTLGEFLDAYLENNRHKVEESTVKTWENPIRNLKEFLGEKTPIHKITQERILAWERWLGEHEKLRPITISRRIGQVKQFFHEAVRLEYLPKNPFACLKRFSVNCDDGEGIVEREDYFRVREILPSAQWRAFADLGRFGALRLPSEAKALHWKDIDWKNKVFVVHSGKTKRYEGKDKRMVPIFPELFESLKECYEQRDPNDDRLFTDDDFQKQGLNTKFREYIKQAGVKVWRKALHRLRASRETELMEEYPISVACKWSGNTPKVAVESYHKMRDVHFENATRATPDFCPTQDRSLGEPENAAAYRNAEADRQALETSSRMSVQPAADTISIVAHDDLPVIANATDRGSECRSRLDQIGDQHTTANTGINEQNFPQVADNCDFMPIPAQPCLNVQNAPIGLPSLFD